MSNFLDYTKPFEEVYVSDYRWNSKDRWLPLTPYATTYYYKTAGDFVDYDGYLEKDSNGLYLVAHIGQGFDAILRPRTFEGGRSAANVRLDDEHRPGKSYLMPANAYFEAVKKTEMVKGMIHGRFTINKKGSNFRLELIQQGT